jgi:hypothetical protein
MENADFTTAAFSAIVKKIAAEGAAKITTGVIKKLLSAKDPVKAVNEIPFIIAEELKKEVAAGVNFKDLLTPVRSREAWTTSNEQVVNIMLEAILNAVNYFRGEINIGIKTALSSGENPKGKNTVQWPVRDAEKKIKRLVEVGLVTLGNNAYHDRLYNAGRK